MVASRLSVEGSAERFPPLGNSPNGGEILRKRKGSLSRKEITQIGKYGPIVIDLGNGYSADSFVRSAYEAEYLELAQKARVLVVKAGLWTSNTAGVMIDRALEKSIPKNASWIGFRKTEAPLGDWLGFTWQEGLTIPVDNEEVFDIHMILRALDPDIQGKGLGKTAMQIMRSHFPEADTIDHRTGSPIAAAAWLDAKQVFKPGRRFPYDQPYTADERMGLIAHVLWKKYHTQGEFLDFETGVSKGDYLEANGAIPSELRSRAREVLLWMTEKKGKKLEIDGKKRNALGMNLQRRDALYEVGELAQAIDLL